MGKESFDVFAVSEDDLREYLYLDGYDGDWLVDPTCKLMVVKLAGDTVEFLFDAERDYLHQRMRSLELDEEYIFI